MWPYYIIFIFIFLIGFISPKSRKNRLLSCITMFVILSLIMGLRHESYAGVDTEVYVSDFNRIIYNNISFGQITSEFYKDYLYYFSSKAFSVICSDVNMWLLFCASVYIGAVSWFIYKYSCSIWLSYLIFVGWDMYAYNFQIIRHTWSLAFVLLAFPFLLKREKLKYGLTMLLAINSQIVSLISIVSFGIVKFKSKVNVLIIPAIMMVLLFVVMTQRDTLISFLFSFDFLSENERFSFFKYRDGGQLVNFTINLIFIILAYYEINKNKKLLLQNEKYETFVYSLLNISIIGLVFYSLQFVIGEFYRIAQYFSIFNIILIPHILHIEKNVLFRKLITLAIVFCLIKHFWGGMTGSYYYDPYRFFWE